MSDTINESLEKEKLCLEKEKIDIEKAKLSMELAKHDLEVIKAKQSLILSKIDRSLSIVKYFNEVQFGDTIHKESDEVGESFTLRVQPRELFSMEEEVYNLALKVIAASIK